MQRGARVCQPLDLEGTIFVPAALVWEDQFLTNKKLQLFYV
jgi:hypothetical protein